MDLDQDQDLLRLAPLRILLLSQLFLTDSLLQFPVDV